MSVLAVVMGAIPLLVSLWRGRAARRRVGVLLTPIVAPVVFAVVLIVVARAGRHSGQSAAHLSAPVAAGMVLLGGAAATLVCALSPPVMIRRLDLSAAEMRISMIATIPVVATMVAAAGTRSRTRWRSATLHRDSTRRSADRRS